MEKKELQHYFNFFESADKVLQTDFSYTSLCEFLFFFLNRKKVMLIVEK